MLGLVVLLGVFILLLSFFIRVRRPKNFPPGPRPWHILGNLLQLDPVNPLKDLERVKCYGNVFSIFMANYDSSWREHRRFTVTTLKNFGLGKQLKSNMGKLQSRMAWRFTINTPCVCGRVVFQAADGDSTFNDTQMGNLILELVMAGTDTISNTHRSAMLHLMTNQHVQDRCRKEIEEVLEGRTDVSFEDRHAMQYVQAVINEVQRIGYTIPLAAFHTTCKDTQLCGYQLPKGTMVIPNLSSVLHEEGQWKFPHEFNPENFLNDKGEFVKPEAFLPFSAGICVCLGEGLARMELFLFVVTLLQRFQFVWPETGGVPDLSLIFGTVCCLNPLHTL
uniref:Uncharacterized protein n=1 Tax=Esox lucius TaxID=8010 RepID=A0AAY5K8Z1_ESOLU